MSYLASIHDVTTGRFLMRCSIEAHDLHEAEQAAIIKAALAIKGHPHEMDVRHLHQRALQKLPELGTNEHALTRPGNETSTTH